MYNPNSGKDNMIVEPSSLVWSPFQENEPLRSTTFNTIFNQYRGSIRNFTNIIGISLADPDFHWQEVSHYEVDDLVFVENPDPDALVEEKYLVFRCNFDHVSGSNSSPLLYVTPLSDTDPWTKLDKLSVGTLTNWYRAELQQLLHIDWDNIQNIPEYLSKDAIVYLNKKFSLYTTTEDLITNPLITVESARTLNGIRMSDNMSVEPVKTIVTRLEDNSINVSTVRTDPRMGNQESLTQDVSVALIDSRGVLIKSGPDTFRSYLKTGSHIHQPKYQTVLRADGFKLEGSPEVTIHSSVPGKMIEFKLPYVSSSCYEVKISPREVTGSMTCEVINSSTRTDSKYFYYRYVGSWDVNQTFIIQITDLSEYGIVKEYVSAIKSPTV